MLQESILGPLLLDIFLNDLLFLYTTNSNLSNYVDVNILYISGQKLKETRIHWLDRRIVRKQPDIMPTYHYVQNQGKLMMQSQENGQKPQFGSFFDDFEAKYLEIANFSEK